MSRKQTRGRALAATLAVLAVGATNAALAASASAASGQGSAAIVLAQHKGGRTLSGQGVRVTATAPASQQGHQLTLPVSALDPGANPSADVGGALDFRHGKRVLTLSGLHFDLAGGSLAGTLGTTPMTVFKLGAAASANAGAGTVSLSEAQLRLTPEAAKLLRSKLGLPRALVHKGVGMAWLAAQADPTHAAAQPVTSGELDWGVLASWRAYVLTRFTPPPAPSDAGEITVEGGATSHGELIEPASFVSFPAASGSFEKGLYGATDQLTLKTSGAIKFAKPMHCIVEVKLSNLEVKLAGASSSLVADGGYEIDRVSGHSCVAEPPVSLPGLTFATLDPSGVTPTYSADGKTVTWTAIPARLTEAAAAMFGGQYPAGKELDPVTITAGIG